MQYNYIGRTSVTEFTLQDQNLNLKMQKRTVEDNELMIAVKDGE